MEFPWQSVQHSTKHPRLVTSRGSDMAVWTASGDGRPRYVPRPGRAATGQGNSQSGTADIRKPAPGYSYVRGERPSSQRYLGKEQRDPGTGSSRTGAGSVGKHRAKGWFGWLSLVRRQQATAGREVAAEAVVAAASGREAARQDRSSEFVSRMAALFKEEGRDPR